MSARGMKGQGVDGSRGGGINDLGSRAERQNSSVGNDYRKSSNGYDGRDGRSAHLGRDKKSRNSASGALTRPASNTGMGGQAEAPAFQQADDELTETLFNQFDNYADYLPMDDVVAMMSGWQEAGGEGKGENGGERSLSDDGQMHLQTPLDDEVPLPAAVQGMLSHSGASEEGAVSGGLKSGGSQGSGFGVSDASSSLADDFDDDDGDGDSRLAISVGKGSKHHDGRKGGSKKSHPRGGHGGVLEGEGGEGAGKVSVDSQKLRNREHARNTRLRKKAYIETLRHQLQSLSDAKDKEDKTELVSHARSLEGRKLKKARLQTFLLYRARGELDRRKWAVLLAEDFVLKLPLTPYRYFPAGNVEQHARYVQGIDATIRDTASFTVLIDSLSRTYRERVRVQFYSEADYIVIGTGPTLMCRWTMRSENAVACGCQTELELCGMLQAEFEPREVKLRRLNVMFDVMGLMQQLRRMGGGALFQTAPSTLQMAEDPTEEPRIVFALQVPFRIRSINEAWMMHYGVTVEDCQNRCVVLERNPLCPVPGAGGGREGGGAGEAEAPVDSAWQYIQFAYECIAKQLSHSLIVLYETKTQGPIGARLRLFPVYTGGYVTHYMGGLTSLRDPSFPTDYPTVLAFR